MKQLWNWQAVAGWLFLVIFGSLLGYRIYMQLLTDIGLQRQAASRSRRPP
jgi:hypothetical protein